jgi:hypothetical protein
MLHSVLALGPMFVWLGIVLLAAVLAISYRISGWAGPAFLVFVASAALMGERRRRAQL